MCLPLRAHVVDVRAGQRYTRRSSTFGAYSGGYGKLMTDVGKAILDTTGVALHFDVTSLMIRPPAASSLCWVHSALYFGTRECATHGATDLQCVCF